jgi:hypothetical protein
MRSVLFLFVFLLVLAPASQAAPIYSTPVAPEYYTGFRDAEINIDGNGPYESIRISWEIAMLPKNLWWYQYTISNYSGPMSDISHFIVEITPVCLTEDLCIVDSSGPYELDEYTNDNGNPGLPEGYVLTGLKFDFGGPAPVVYWFTSTRAPVWGDAYVKGGGMNKETAAWALNKGAWNHASQNILDFVARPDGPVGEVPENGTLALLGAGLVVLDLLGKRQCLSQR